MNTSIQNPRPNWILQTSAELSKKKEEFLRFKESAGFLFLRPCGERDWSSYYSERPWSAGALPPKNFWVNPTFELGSNLGQTDGTVSNWNRSGSDGSIDQARMGNSVSPTHFLSLLDTNENGYGEWYGFLTLFGVATGDMLDLQWFQLYSVSNAACAV